MLRLIQLTVGVFFKDEDWADYIFNLIIKEITNDNHFTGKIVKCHSMRDSKIFFDNGSCIRFIKADNSVKGGKFDRVLIQKGIDKEYINIYIRPCILEPIKDEGWLYYID